MLGSLHTTTPRFLCILIIPLRFNNAVVPSLRLCKRLRENGLKYSLLYPSKLRVVDGGYTRYFENPATAAPWLDSH